MGKVIINCPGTQPVVPGGGADVPALGVAAPGSRVETGVCSKSAVGVSRKVVPGIKGTTKLTRQNWLRPIIRSRMRAAPEIRTRCKESSFSNPYTDRLHSLQAFQAERSANTAPSASTI